LGGPEKTKKTKMGGVKYSHFFGRREKLGFYTPNLLSHNESLGCWLETNCKFKKGKKR